MATAEIRHVSTPGSLTPPAIKDSFNTILQHSVLKKQLTPSAMQAIQQSPLNVPIV